MPFTLDHGDRVVANFIRRGDFLVLQRLLRGGRGGRRAEALRLSQCLPAQISRMR